MKEIESHIEETEDNNHIPCITLIADKNGKVFIEENSYIKPLESENGQCSVGGMLKCKNAEHAICGESEDCEYCEVRRSLTMALSKKQKRAVRVVQSLAEGKTALLDVDIIPFGNDENGKAFVTVAERDSTYMKIFLTDRENYHYEDFFYSNLDKLNLLIWSCDLDGNMKNMSNSMLSLIGISKKDMLEGKWKESIPFDLRKLASVFINRNESYEVETRILDYKKEPRWLLVRISEHTDHEGRVDGFIGKCTNITAIKTHQIEINQKIRDAEIVKKNTQEFIAKLSHEVRTPLNGILGMSELLLRTEMNGDQREDVSIIKSSSLNMLRLVNDMLDITRIESGKILLMSTKFSIEGIIRDVLRASEAFAKSKGIELIAEVNLKGNDTAIGDQDRIRQVVSNLVTNGIKFTNSGNVTVRVTSSRNKMMDDGMYNYHFEIEDTGIGIPKNEISRLFKNYVQLETSLQGKNSGLGLGLAISKGLVELMGGEIWAKNKVGKGACFVFELPLMSNKMDLGEEVSTEVSKEVVELELDRSEGLNALVAEDNEMNRYVIEKLLEGMKYKVEIVENGYEALKAFQNKSYDIVFMDIQMPIMDGIETTKKIREMENGKSHIPIIAVTAFAIKGDKEKFIENGMDGYISKPISLFEMKAEIRRVEDLIKKHQVERNTVREGKAEVTEGQGLTTKWQTEEQSESAKRSIEVLFMGLKAALESENEFASESLIYQLKELALETKNTELKDKVLKIAMSYRSGNYERAIEHLN